MSESAGVPLVHLILVVEHSFSEIKVFNVAGIAPNHKADTKPVRFGTALVAMAFDNIVFTDSAAGIDKPLIYGVVPTFNDAVQILLIVGFFIKHNKRFVRADASVAVSNRKRIEMFVEIGHMNGGVQIFLFARQSVGANKTFNSVEYAGDVCGRVPFGLLFVFVHAIGIAEARNDDVHIEIGHFLRGRKGFFGSESLVSGKQTEHESTVAPKDWHFEGLIGRSGNVNGFVPIDFASKMAVFLLVLNDFVNDLRQNGRNRFVFRRGKRGNFNISPGNIAAVVEKPALLIEVDVVEDERNVVDRTGR